MTDINTVTSAEHEWDAGPGLVAEPYAKLDGWTQRALTLAWTYVFWAQALKLRIVARLGRLSRREREPAAQALCGLFNPEPPVEFRDDYVTLGDLEPARFWKTLERFLPPAANSRETPVVIEPSPPASDVPWPEPRNEDEELRRAAIAYFAGRVRPFAFEEVAEFFGVSVDTVKRWRRDVRVFVRGGVVRIPVEEVYTLILAATP